MGKFLDHVFKLFFHLGVFQVGTQPTKKVDSIELSASQMFQGIQGRLGSINTRLFAIALEPPGFGST